MPAVIALTSSWIKWMEENLITCPSVKYFNIDCPGCGMQRSFIALLGGNLHLSIQMYPALLPLMLLCAYAILHLKYKFFSGSKIIICLQVVVVGIIAAHYIYKIFTNQIIH